MNAEILQDSIDLDSSTIEAVLLDPADPSTFPSSYPFPRLRPTGRASSVNFRTVTLTNAFLSVTFALDLGGRIIRLQDRRTGTEIIEMPKAIRPTEGGARGVIWEHGLEFFIADIPRLTGLASVESIVREPEEPGDPAELVLFELIPGTGMSFQLTWRLPADAALLELEVQIHNRQLESVHGVSGLRWHQPGLELLATETEWLAWHADRACGVGCVFELGTWDLAETTAQSATIRRRAVAAPTLAPRQVDTYRCTFVPISGLNHVTAFSEHGAMSVGPSLLSIQASCPIQAGKVILQLPDGKALEAPLQVQPERIETFDLAGLPAAPVAVAIRDEAKRDLLLMRPGSEDHVPLEAMPDGAMFVEPIARGYDPMGTAIRTREAGNRGGAHLALAYRAIAGGDFVAADRHLEESLLFNGNDPLTWWLKAVLQRQQPEVPEDRPELLNAHFLSPMEPALRAESFLQQNDACADPNPVMRPLAGHPDALLEVVHLLIEANLTQEAIRLIDEGLRHGEQPMLRLMAAWLFDQRTRMTVEAADHLVQLDKSPLQPPYPWRTFEITAVRELLERHPDHARLKAWAAILDGIAVNP